MRDPPETGSLCSACPPVVPRSSAPLGFRPCEQLRGAQRPLCVSVTGSAKRDSPGRRGEAGWCVEGGARLVLKGWEPELQPEGERGPLGFAGLPHCGGAAGLSLALPHSGYKEGISSSIYSISCHADP